MKFKIATFCLAFGAILGSAESAKAIPVLQVYIEGATYQAGDDGLGGEDTWVLDNFGSGSSSLRLWVIGNPTTATGAEIRDVRLSAAYDATKVAGFSMTITGSTTLGLGGFTDPSLAADGVFLQSVTDGSAPILSDGSSLPSHGIYGAGTYWDEFYLGDMNLTDSPIADFQNSFPTPTTTMGQINVYDITVTATTDGSPDASVHFDVYDGLYSSSGAFLGAVNAPFSHDGSFIPGGDDEQPLVPEPGSLLLFGMGIAGVAGTRLRRRKTSEIVEA